MRGCSVPLMMCLLCVCGAARSVSLTPDQATHLTTVAGEDLVFELLERAGEHYELVVSYPATVGARALFCFEISLSPSPQVPTTFSFTVLPTTHQATPAFVGRRLLNAEKVVLSPRVVGAPRRLLVRSQHAGASHLEAMEHASIPVTVLLSSCALPGLAWRVLSNLAPVLLSWLALTLAALWVGPLLPWLEQHAG